MEISRKSSFDDLLKLEFPSLAPVENAQMKSKVYEPYCISNSTILQYGDQEEGFKLSLHEIISQFMADTKKKSILYFKVYPQKKGE